MRRPNLNGPSLQGNRPQLNSLIPQALNQMPKVATPTAKKVSLKLPSTRKVRPRIAMPHLKPMNFGNR